MVDASLQVQCCGAAWCISLTRSHADLLNPPIDSTANGRCLAPIATCVSWYFATFCAAAASASLPGPVIAVARLVVANVSATVTSHCHITDFSDWVVLHRQPDRQVSYTSPVWFLPSPRLSLHSSCLPALRHVATRSGVVRRRVRARSMRRRPLRPLSPTSLPRTTRLSQTLTPTTQTRQTRTPRQRRKEPLWAAKWMDECLELNG